MKTHLLAAVLLASQLHLVAAESRAPKPDFVAHEWGTFTSVQASDGIQLEWNPLQVSELPRFVYDLNRPVAGTNARPFLGYLGKSTFRMLQRMETPVIYFYADRETSVDVTVNFPNGRITEWFPQVASPATLAWNGRSSTANWKNLRILPQAQLAAPAASLFDCARAPRPSPDARETSLPFDNSGSHYYAARETDANLITVQTDATTPAEREKFLFYRGVGNFLAPLQVQVFGANDETMQLINQGTEPLGSFFVLQVTPAGAKFTTHSALAPTKHHQIELAPGKNLRPLAEVVSDLSSQMKAALVKEGLYEREAAAMVATWRDSWFEETGVRVLYTLPRAWADRTLPLTMEPKQREIVRVMVGRAEVITPAMEWSFLKQVVHYSEADAAKRPQVIADTRALGLGRFLQPAASRLIGRVPGQPFSSTAWELMQAASKPAPAGKSVALK